MLRIKVLRPGLLTTVQDMGRRGYEHLGIMVGGHLDDYAAAWANRLVNNPPGSALLEITLLGPELEALDDGWAALAGADLGAYIGESRWSPGHSRYLKTGDRIGFSGIKRGARAYLAFAGGIDVPDILGSRSTDLVSKFGGFEGRGLKPGDVLNYHGGEAQLMAAPVESGLCREKIRILPGVHLTRFSQDTWNRLQTANFRVSPHSDRIGIRLEGDALSAASLRGDAISEGLAIGSIEVPPSGELLILLKSRGSIGGYPTIAHVIQADWPVLAQLKPGDRVHLRGVSAVEAREALEEQRTWLNLDPTPI